MNFFLLLNKHIKPFKRGQPYDGYKLKTGTLTLQIHWCQCSEQQSAHLWNQYVRMEGCDPFQCCVIRSKVTICSDQLPRLYVQGPKTVAYLRNPSKPYNLWNLKLKSVSSWNLNLLVVSYLWCLIHNRTVTVCQTWPKIRKKKQRCVILDLLIQPQTDNATAQVTLCHCISLMKASAALSGTNRLIRDQYQWSDEVA